jgi:hypothetical protein
MEKPNIDWLWVLWAALYSLGFWLLELSVAIPNAWPIYFLGLVALASLKYLIRFPG